MKIPEEETLASVLRFCESIFGFGYIKLSCQIKVFKALYEFLRINFLVPYNTSSWNKRRWQFIQCFQSILDRDIANWEP